MCNIPLESSWQGLQLCFRPHINRRSSSKVMGPQSCRSRNFGNFVTPKCHLDVGLVERHIVYYKGEGGGFPQVRVVVCLVSPSLLMVLSNTKSAPTMHWPTCCLVLCRSVWVNKCLSFFLVPFWNSNTPSILESATSQGACANSWLFHCFHFIFTFESIQELGCTSSCECQIIFIKKIGSFI